ncbi:MAG: hypothetical protein ACTS22_03500 [Phycisphaerales bacterium]
MRHAIIASLAPCLAVATTHATDGATARSSLLAPYSPAVAPAVQVLGSPSVADDTFVKLRAGAFLMFQSGSIQVGDGISGAQSVLDFDDTLNQDSFAVSPIGSIAFAIPTVDLLIELGFLGSYTYDGTTDGITIAYDDQEFTGTIGSEQSYEIYTADVLWEALELSIFKIHIGAGVRFFDVESELSGTVSGSPATADARAFVPLPVIAAGARADLGSNFFVAARAAGMTYGDYGTLLDGSLEIGWDFFRNAGVFAGYRVISADADAFDVEFDLTLGGPYAGLEFRL